MKKVWIWIGSIVGVLVIAASITLWVKNKNAQMASFEPEEMGIVVQKATERELTESILVSGKIVPEGSKSLFRT
ncbi:hypothetical protein ACI2OX_02825 [Bacillus sp. N9]